MKKIRVIIRVRVKVKVKKNLIQKNYINIKLKKMIIMKKKNIEIVNI